MPENRHPKRQRKKEAAAAKREARIAAARRARKQRLLFLAVLTAILVGGGAAVAFLGTRDDPPEDVAADTEPTPTPEPTPQPIACDGERPPEADTEKPSFEEPEDQELASGSTYVLRLDTSCGVIDIELDHARAPETVNSIVFLARHGFYDGLTFHRIVPEFVIQGGDPMGIGQGGPGYQVEEPPPGDLEYTRGVVAMAKTGPDPPGTSGSQFFIVTGEETGLEPEYALLGHVVDGFDAVDAIEAIPGDPPAELVYIKTAMVIER